VVVGLRMALVITVPMVVGASVGELVPATTVCLGALNAGMADVGGAQSSRWHALIAAMVLDALAISVGTVAGLSPWAAIPLMFVVALACGLSNLFGNVAANVGFVVGILYMVGVGTPGGGALATQRLWLTLLGGAWAIVVVLVVWPVRPFAAAATQVSDCCATLAGLIRTAAASRSVTGPGTAPAFASAAHGLRDRIGGARSVLVATRTQRRGDSAQGRRLLVELGEIRRILDVTEGLVAIDSMMGNRVDGAESPMPVPMDMAPMDRRRRPGASPYRGAPGSRGSPARSGPT
jgi:hypothetical protein